MGGQGAPLVPIGDQILFQEYDLHEFGWFSNVS
jgi:1,6-anhydro-N-acetylmuramate kinase